MAKSSTGSKKRAKTDVETEIAPEWVRLTISVDPTDATALKEVAAANGTSVAALVRALLEYSLSRVTSDEQLAGVIQREAETSKARRIQAGALGGRRGAKSRASRVDQALFSGQGEPVVTTTPPLVKPASVTFSDGIVPGGAPS